MKTKINYCAFRIKMIQLFQQAAYSDLGLGTSECVQHIEMKNYR